MSARLGALLAALCCALTAPATALGQPDQVERSRTVFAVLCTDDPTQAGVRDAALADHLAFVEAHSERYAVAGPLYDDAGAMTRSLFLIYAEDEAEARAFMANDPYVARGLYAEMEYRRFLPAAGNWIGGVVWTPGG